MIQKVSFHRGKRPEIYNFYEKNNRSQKKPYLVKKTIYLIILYSLAGYGR